MLFVVIMYLYLSLLLYLLLGGADFGAGILEMFTSSRNQPRTRRITYLAIGPVWEANHMWLIIFIVILFVGFPEIYTTFTTYLHIPLLLMLLGIILRGTAFIFRHYDAVRDRMQTVYNAIFVYSSFITPMILGMIAGAVISGNINPYAHHFSDLYLKPWLNIFCFMVGLFTVALCAFLAAVYLIGEAVTSYDQRRFVSKAIVSNILALLAGIGVFLTSHWAHFSLWQWIFGNPVGKFAIIAALISLGWLWYACIRGRRKFLLRMLACFQVTMILLAVGYHHFPDFMILQNGTHVSLFIHRAPDATINALAWALLGGSLFILPFLIYLFYSFREPAQADMQ
ncbi:cytochrome d ubiquinol oxidase subunit II [Thermoflavifilum thermophilum]|uniref:Cytochrome bd-I ubiquinol oxidase subunit 2 apoprotein n=1 Tax=Thermoflavifilum thermophilum TaxID=1393122 RepID=A0A1I7NIG9_9BACT|nr:cytochrome d ubiquinol oxidase subunit II [Thermoflavifilum thermophilum]SFV34447.1 cytochrome bd-I ubiquinol oxidase subunit 2 apoprotein [Thermoflavifilum thermophilum]